jgi:hypothetical protein
MDFGIAEITILAIILSRILVPLLIIRFPLPAIVACLIIDAVDQSVFAAVAPNADLSGYQNYDKALDIYYLVIAYISTLRNWTNPFALGVARFLIYYRLIGVALFELTGIREVLFIFPNTFEYFFIFYESVRLFWNPRRMSKKLVVGAAAFIWIFVKLPQEYWIHIAQLDLTDFVQEDIFGVAPGTSWIDTFAAKPWIVVIAVVVVAALVYAAYWLMKNKLPPRDRPLTIDADAEPGREVPAERLDAERGRMAKTFLRPGLFEKLAMIGLVSVIFAKVLGVEAEPLQLTIIVSIVVIANAGLSTLLERRGFGPTAALRQFIFTGLLNLGIIAVLALIYNVAGSSFEFTTTFFYLLLITLLVTLYDRYRPEYVARFSPAEEAAST